jgi:sensor histidine kinase YesM
MKRSHQILLHIAFWLIFNVLQYARYIALNYGDISPAFYLVVGVQIILNLITFYGSYFFVFAKIFDHSKLRSLGLLVFYILANTIFRIYISRFVFSFVEKETWLDKYNSIWLQTLFVFTYTGLSFLVRFTIRWFHDQQLKTELRNQKQAGELALLRAQINPHFLFNTLNSIYSLALQKSDNVAVSIARLSEIMRYMLKDPDVEKVPLEKEIEYLVSYIELQKLRINSQKFIQFDIKGDVSDKMIAPMLLIPFVENAFKHGSKKVSPPGIIIIIEIEKLLLKLNVSNFIKEKNDQTDNDAHGTGLDNVKQRLDMIYKDRYQLEISENKDRKRFEVYLTIELK